MNVSSAARALLAAVWLTASAGPLAAQEAVNYATLGGRIIDPQGAVVPGARVSARHIETNQQVDATSDDGGRFRFAYLAVGPYELVAELDGFAPARRSVVLSVGSAFDLTVALGIGTLAVNVAVTADAPVIDTSRTQSASTITRSEVGSVPLNGRNFLDLALLAPGVAPTNIGGTQQFAETSAVPGPGLSVASQRNFSNNFIVDGLSANDDAAGLSGIVVGVDAVEQFQVVTSGGQAELGRALGGYVNVVTRSGTNATHGDVYGYFRDRRLNAANALTGTRLPMTQTQYGGSIGGPLRRDRTFYFANVEQRRLDQSGLTTIAPANVTAINTRLAALGYGGVPVSTGTYASPIDTTNILAKVDQRLNGGDRLTLRYLQYDAAAGNARGAGGLSAPTASAALDNRDQALSIANTWSLSGSTINEARAQMVRSRLAAPPSDPEGPAVSIAGVASFGTLSTSPTARHNTMWQVADTLSSLAGAHAVRTGFDVIVNQDTITFPRATRGAYTFASLASFLSGTYNASGFTQTFGATEVSQSNPNVGLFLQDEWKPAPGWTINLGLRYDLQFLQTIATDRNNLAPRAGIAWSPGADGRTVIRANAGLFYDRVPLRALANALLSAGNTTDIAQLRQISVTLSPGQAQAPVFPAILAAPVPLVTLVNLTTMDPHLRSAYSQQAGIELERQVGRRLTLGAGYSYVRGRNLLVQINQNVPGCPATGTNNGCRPIATYANNNQYSAAGASSYHGLHVSLLQRPARWGSVRVSYTLSKSMNNVGENFFSAPIDPFDLSKDWGRSDDDQRHRLVVSGTASSSSAPAQTWWQHVTHGFHASGLLQYYSATPFNIVSGVTTVQGTAGRPMVDGRFIPRNAGTGSAFFSVGLRVSRAVPIGGTKVDLFAEGFNLTNHRNVLTRNTNFGSGAYPDSPLPSFNQITAVGDPRTVQLGARIAF